MRVFIGIKVDSKAQNKIKSYFNLFYENKVRGNYTKISNLHMTLVFLGEISEDKIPILKSIINSVKLEVNEIKLSKISTIKDILVSDIEENEGIVHMYNDLATKLEQANFKFEKHKLYPHITLIRKAENYERFIGCEMNITSTFDKITLFESKRINNELIYIDLGE